MESYGAKRWVSILGFSIQPSEIAKFALVIFTASYMSDNHEKVKTFKGLLPVLGVGGIMCLLIMLEPSMSVTMCIAYVPVFAAWDGYVETAVGETQKLKIVDTDNLNTIIASGASPDTDITNGTSYSAMSCRIFVSSRHQLQHH